MAIRRRSSITARFQKMRGLGADEKRVLTRIGELIDGTINNRAPTNPGGEGSRKILRLDSSLPPPTGLAVQLGVRSAKLTWTPVNSSFLNFYEIRITDGATGQETVNIAYSNSFTVRDKFGFFSADVRSVGRDGTVSPFTTLTFEIGNSVMYYEGEKAGPEELSNENFLDIYVPKGYNVFIWGCSVYDSFADPTANNQASYKISVGDGFYAGSLTPIQVTNNFEEEITFTNLSAGYDLLNNARPGGAPTRTANFQTSKAMPFSPYLIRDDFANQANRFWITETQRDDVVSLGINAWVTTAGIGFTTGSGSVVQSLEFSDTATPSSLANSGGNVIGQTGDFTIMLWLKPTGTLSGSFDVSTTFSFQISPSVANKGIDINFTKIRDIFNIPVEYLQTSVQIGSGSTSTRVNDIAYNIDAWNLMAATYNSSTKTISIYANGALLGTLTSASWLNTFTDTARTYLLIDDTVVASGKETRLFWAAFWSSALSAAEITYLYSGVASSTWNSFDLTANSGTYASSGTLKHWHRPGIGNLGDDEGPLPITLTPVNVTTANLVTDSPS